MKFLIIPDLLVSNKIPYIVNACACTQLKCLLATRMCLPTVLSDNYTLSGGGYSHNYIGYTGMCHWRGYGFQAIWSGKGYGFPAIWSGVGSSNHTKLV